MSQPADLVVIAEGSTRLCLCDMSDPRYCLKLQLHARDRTPAGPRERFRRWLGWQIPYFGDNATELRAWRQLQRRLGANALAGRIAACHGMVDSAEGPALQCELVLLPDGEPAPSLHDLLTGDDWPRPRHPRGADDPEALCAAVEDFAGWLKRHDIPLFDLNAGNFVVLPGPRLVCIDAKSLVAGKEVVPVSRWFPSLMHRKIDRRAERLKARIRTALRSPPEAAPHPGREGIW